MSDFWAQWEEEVGYRSAPPEVNREAFGDHRDFTNPPPSGANPGVFGDPDRDWRPVPSGVNPGVFSDGSHRGRFRRW